MKMPPRKIMMMDNKSDFDKQLQEIAGGNYGDDFWYAVKKMGNNYAAIREALDTNICPVCSQQIIPGASKCEATVFFAHLHGEHPDL